jgi:hypothetical protein
MKIDERLRDILTDAQADAVEKYEQGMTYRDLGKKLGIDGKSAQQRLQAAKKKLAKRGFSPEFGWESPVPDGFKVHGVSQYFPETRQWVKCSEVKDKTEYLKNAIIEAIKENPIRFDDKNIAASDVFSDDVIPWLNIGDAHVGMLAHASETLSNFDIKIASSEICSAVGMLIDELPICERIVINDLGDFTHYTNFEAVSKSGHQFDFDTRFPKMIKAAVQIMRFIVDSCLKKARNVDVILNLGNHSSENDIWMRILIEHMYESTGRVHVLNNDNPFIGYRMGNTLVMTNHSDKCAPKNLIGVMITDFRKDFGETKFHYIDVGHWHTSFVIKEHPSIIIESFNHLAALDMWAHHKGYRSRRSMTIVLRSKLYGEVGRRILHIEEIMDKLAKKDILLLDSKLAYSPYKTT